MKVVVIGKTNKLYINKTTGEQKTMKRLFVSYDDVPEEGFTGKKTKEITSIICDIGDMKVGKTYDLNIMIRNGKGNTMYEQMVGFTEVS